MAPLRPSFPSFFDAGAWWSWWPKLSAPQHRRASLSYWNELSVHHCLLGYIEHLFGEASLLALRQLGRQCSGIEFLADARPNICLFHPTSLLGMFRSRGSPYNCCYLSMIALPVVINFILSGSSLTGRFFSSHIALALIDISKDVFFHYSLRPRSL